MSLPLPQDKSLEKPAAGKRFSSPAEYRAWIDSQSWYQTMTLPSGQKIEGKIPTHQREDLLRTLDFKGKRVLDVGCNSGQYCFLAKQQGAASVTGIDVDDIRLMQARTVALNEDLDIDFQHRGLFEAPDALGSFDIVFCFAVLTEIQDFFGSVDALKKLIGDVGFLEIRCADRGWFPFNPRTWFKTNTTGLRLWESFTEVQRTRQGLWVIHPTFALLQKLFGESYTLRRLGPGVRYEMIEIRRAGG